MAAASAGRVRNVHTLAEAYCNLIMASTSAGDWERAAEWCELVDEFAREHGTMPLLGAVPHDPRRRARRQGPLAGGRARARDRARDPRPVHPGDGRAHRGEHGRAARPPGPARRGRAAARRARGAPVVAVRARAPAHRRRPAPGRGRRCSSAALGAARGRRRSAPRSCSRRSSTRGWRAATSRAPRWRPAQLAELAESSGIRLVEARARLAAAHVEPRGRQAGTRRRSPRAPRARRLRPPRRCR